jgi:leader peptidase (prepilin peptidase) / N-methyltransferase
MTGHLAVWPALVTGILIGGVSAILLLISRRGGLKTYMPYGPFLALGALLALWQPWRLWWG